MLASDPSPYQLSVQAGDQLAGHMDWDEGSFWIRQEHPRDPNWYVLAIYVSAQKNPRLVELSLKPTGHLVATPRLTAELLRQVALPRLNEAAVRWLNEHPDALAFFAGPPEKPGGRPGRAGRDDAYYAGWAAAYLKACDREGAPFPRLAREQHVSVATAKWNIGEARRRKLLTSLGRGRSGGKLTDKAKELLDGPR